MYATDNNHEGWKEGTAADWDSTYYSWNHGGFAWTESGLQFEIVTTDGTIIYSNVLSSVDGGNTGVGNSANCEISSAYSYDEQNEYTSKIGTILAAIAAGFILVGILIFVVVLVRRKKGHKVAFDETIDGPEDIDDNDVEMDMDKQNGDENETITTTME